MSTPSVCARVIANCHCLPLADALALNGHGLTTDFIDVTFATLPHMVEKIETMLRGADTGPVFTFPLSSQLGALETTSLRAILGDRLHSFTNIHFAGLHPDITYIGGMNSRFTGFFGDYHSKLVLYAYAAGRSQAECLALFNGKIFEAAGYFDAYGQAANELLQRDEACDIKFAAEFLALLPRSPSLYTVNHPTGEVFNELASKLAAAAGLPYAKFPAAYMQNHLSTNYIWPVHDEIAEQHGLAYRTPLSFVLPAGRGGRAVSLPEFIAGSYAAYAQIEHGEFAAMVRDLYFYPRFAAAL